LIRDAKWIDVDKDKRLDLVLIGEWMGVHVFKNSKGKFEDISEKLGLSNLKGWWNTIQSADLDNDGDEDLILGNHGLNSRFRASESKPIQLFASDFDNNGFFEQILCTYNGEESYPLVLHQNITAQLPYLKTKYLKNESYKNRKSMIYLRMNNC